MEHYAAKRGEVHRRCSAEEHMKKTKDKRFVILEALICYADQSGTFNPHFYKDEMLKILNVAEGDFNIMQKQLGDEYCHMVDSREGRTRYAISVNRCLALRDQIDQAKTEEKRHREGVRIAVLTTLLGALLGFILGRCSI